MFNFMQGFSTKVVTEHNNDDETVLTVWFEPVSDKYICHVGLGGVEIFRGDWEGNLKEWIYFIITKMEEKENG